MAGKIQGARCEEENINIFVIKTLVVTRTNVDTLEENQPVNSQTLQENILSSEHLWKQLVLSYNT
jgi:hypothetical protein